jgi:hypothetical protein
MRPAFGKGPKAPFQLADVPMFGKKDAYPERHEFGDQEKIIPVEKKRKGKRRLRPQKRAEQKGRLGAGACGHIEQRPAYRRSPGQHPARLAQRASFRDMSRRQHPLRQPAKRLAQQRLLGDHQQPA